MVRFSDCTPTKLVDFGLYKDKVFTAEDIDPYLHPSGKIFLEEAGRGYLHLCLDVEFIRCFQFNERKSLSSYAKSGSIDDIRKALEEIYKYIEETAICESERISNLINSGISENFLLNFSVKLPSKSREWWHAYLIDHVVGYIDSFRIYLTALRISHGSIIDTDETIIDINRLIFQYIDYFAHLFNAYPQFLHNGSVTSLINRSQRLTDWKNNISRIRNDLPHHWYENIFSSYQISGFPRNNETTG